MSKTIQFTCPKCGAIGGSSYIPLCHRCPDGVYMKPSISGVIIDDPRQIQIAYMTAAGFDISPTEINKVSALLKLISEAKKVLNENSAAHAHIIEAVQNVPTTSIKQIGYISSRALHNLNNNPEAFGGYGISRGKLIKNDVAVFVMHKESTET